jgi:ubiquinone/menaquinone biosynthesis C-methylase UbiE
VQRLGLWSVADQDGAVSEDRNWSAEFDAAFRNVANNAQRRIERAVYGEEYPEGVDPYSFISRTELHLLAEELRVGAGEVLGDLGCGRGGPGLWLAAKTGADLVGVDISAVALEAAAARAVELGLGNRVRYQLGSFADTGLPTASLDAVVSIDALIFAPDKRAAVVEFARILRPAGRLGVTTWDYHRQPVGRPPQVDDHRSLLTAAGFTVHTYTETDDWRHRLTAVTDGLAEAVQEIADETGEDVSEVRAAIREARRTVDDMIRRVLILAERDETS